MEHRHPGTLDDVVAPPVVASPEMAAVTASAATLRARAAKLLGASALGFVVAVGAMMVTQSPLLGAIVFLGSAVLASVGAGHGIAAIVKGFGATPGATGILGAVSLTAVNLF